MQLFNRFFILLALCGSVQAAAQSGVQHNTKTGTDLLHVFLEGFAEEEFFRNEINWVSYTRNRQDADVHVQITPEITAGDGSRTGVYFFGANRFEGQTDTVWYMIYLAENRGSQREKLLLAYKQGLLPFLLQTDLAEQLVFKLADAEAKDRWRPPPGTWGQRIWQVNFNGQHFINRDKSSNLLFGGDTDRRSYATFLNSELSTWKITEQWRQSGAIQIRSNQSGSKTIDGIAFVPDSRNKANSFDVFYGAAYAVKPRFSVGGNIDLYAAHTRDSIAGAGVQTSDIAGMQLGLGFEQSIFSYKDFFRKRLLFGYYGYAFFNRNTPIPFDRPFRQEVFISGAVIKRWGFVQARAAVIQQPREKVWDVYTFRGNLTTGLNIWRNLQMRVEGRFLVSNDLYDELRPSLVSEPIPNSRNARFVRANVQAGIYWTFGSRYLNAVNPRMQSDRYSYSNTFN